MAEAFNIGATLNIQNVIGIREATQKINAGLKNANVDVNVRVSAASLRTLDDLNAKIATLRTNLQSISGSVNSLTSGIGSIGTSSGKAAGNVGQMSSALATARGVMKGFSDSTNEGGGALDKFGAQAGLAARRFAAFTVAAGGMLAFVNGIRTGIKEAVQFERGMITLAQVSGETSDRVGAIRTEIARLSTTLGVSSKELLDVGVTLKQAGLSATETKTALEALAQTSLAPNFTSMAQTAEGAIAILRQFDREVTNLKPNLGGLNAVAGEFAVEASDLITAIRTAGGTFKQTGGSLNELLGLFTAVRSTTRESADSIATGFRTIFTRVQRPETVEALKQLQINLRYTREEAERMGKPGNQSQFVGGFEAIKRISEGLSKLRTTDPRYSGIIEELGGYRQISRVIPLIQQFGEAQRALNVAQAGSTSLQIQAEKAQESLAVKTAKVKEEFLELFRTIADDKGFRSLTENLLAGASAMGKLLEAAKPLIPVLSAVVVKNAVQGVAGLISGQGFLSKGVSALTGSQSSPSASLPANVRRYARGGPVHGIGDTDNVPAYLMPGEFVIKKASAQRIGYDTLNDWNEGRQTQRYSIGGVVKNAMTAFKAYTLPYLPYQAGVEKVSGSSKLRNVLAGADALANKGIQAAVLAGYLPPAMAGLGMVVPPVSGAYLAVKRPGLATNFAAVAAMMFGGDGNPPVPPTNGMDRSAIMAQRRFAKGGPAGSDTIPALLTPGEFVFNKEAVARIGAARLQKANVFGYAKGGLVGENGPLRLANGSEDPIEVPKADLRKAIYKNVISEMESLGIAIKDLKSVFVKIGADGKAAFAGIGAAKPVFDLRASKYDRPLSDAENKLLGQPHLANQFLKVQETAREHEYYKTIHSVDPKAAETFLNRGFVQGVAGFNPKDYVPKDGETQQQAEAKGFHAYVSNAIIRDQLLSNYGRAKKKIAGGISPQRSVGETGAENPREIETYDSPFIPAPQHEEVVANAPLPGARVYAGRNIAVGGSGSVSQRGQSLIERMRAKNSGLAVPTPSPANLATAAQTTASTYNAPGLTAIFSGVGSGATTLSNLATAGTPSPFNPNLAALFASIGSGASSLSDLATAGTPSLPKPPKASRRRPAKPKEQVATETGASDGGDKIPPKPLAPSSDFPDEPGRPRLGPVSPFTLTSGRTGLHDLRGGILLGGEPSSAIPQSPFVYQPNYRPRVGEALAYPRQSLILPPPPSPLLSELSAANPYILQGAFAGGRPNLGNSSPARFSKDLFTPQIKGIDDILLDGEPGVVNLAAKNKLDGTLKRRGGAELFSETTKTSLLNKFGDQALAQEEKAFLTAQQRGLNVLNSNISSIERELMAREEWIKVKNGETKLIKDASGRTLGSAGLVEKLGDKVPGPTYLEQIPGRLRKRISKIDDYTGNYASSFFGKVTAAPGALDDYTGNIASSVYHGGSKVSGYLADKTRRFGNFLNSGVGTSLAFGLPVIGGIAENYAGDANAAIGRGENPGSGGRFTAAKTATGALSGAVSGAILGSVFGPFGTAIGAAAGGLYGFISALGDAKKELRQAQLNKDLTTFGERLNILANAGTKASGDTISEAQGLLNDIKKGGDEKAKAEAGRNPLSFFDIQSRNLRQDFGGQLPQLTQALNKQAEELGRTRLGSSLDSIVSQLESGRGGLNRAFIRLIADVRGQSIKTVLEDFKKVAEEARRSAIAERDSLNARRGDEGNLNAFGRFVLAVQGASDAAHHFNDKISVLSDVFASNLSPTKVNLGGDRLGQLGRADSQVTETLNTFRAFGTQGSRLADVGGIGSRLEESLPGILTNVLSRGHLQEEDISTAVRNALTNQFSPAENQNSNVLNAINTVVSNLNQFTAHGGRRLQEEGSIDVTGLSSRLVQGILDPVKAAGQAIARSLDDQANRFISGVTDLAERTRHVGELYDRVASLQISSRRQSADFTDQNAFAAPGSAVSRIPISQLQGDFTYRQQRLTGLNATDAVDPTAIANRRRQVEGQLVGADARVRDVFQRTGGRGAEYTTAVTSLVGLKDAAQNLNRALLNLADASSRNAVAQERLQGLQASRQGRLGYAERYLAADPTEKLQMNRGALLLDRANQQGNFSGFNHEEFKLVADLAQSLTHVRAERFGGETVGNRFNSLVANTPEVAGFVNNSPSENNEINSLQQQVLKNLADAEKALREVAAAQTSNIQTLRQTLEAQQATFFTNLDRRLATLLQTDLVNRQGSLTVQRTRLNEQEGQAGALRRIGITTNAQLENAQTTLRPSIESYFNNRNVVRDAGRNFDRIQESLGGGLPSLINQSGLNSRSIRSEEGRRSFYSRLLDPENGIPGLNTLDESQRTNIRARIESSVSRGGYQFTPGLSSDNGQTFNSSVQQLVTLAIRQELSGTRTVNDQTTTVGRAVNNQNTALDTLRRSGVNTNVLSGMNDAQGNSLVQAFGSFATSTERLEELPNRIQAVNAQITGIAEELARVRQQLAAPQARASGGVINPSIFKPKGTDTVPAMLTPGEFVINKASTEANYGLLHKINSAKGPIHLAEGGPVNGAAAGLGALIGIPSALLGGYLYNDIRNSLAGRPTTRNIESILSTFQGEHGIDFRQLAPGGITGRETNNGGLFFTRSRRIALSTAPSGGHLASTLGHELGHGAIHPDIQNLLDTRSVRRFANQALRYGGVNYGNLGYRPEVFAEEAFANLFGEAVSGFRPQAVENAGNPGRRYDVLVQRFRRQFLPQLQNVLGASSPANSVVAPLPAATIPPARPTLGPISPLVRPPVSPVAVTEEAAADYLLSLNPSGGPSGGFPSGRPTLGPTSPFVPNTPSIPTPPPATANAGPGRLSRFLQGARDFFTPAPTPVQGTNPYASGTHYVRPQESFTARWGRRFRSFGAALGESFPAPETINIPSATAAPTPVSAIPAAPRPPVAPPPRPAFTASPAVMSAEEQAAGEYLLSLNPNGGPSSFPSGRPTLGPTSSFVPNAQPAATSEGLLARLTRYGGNIRNFAGNTLSSIRNSYAGVGTVSQGVGVAGGFGRNLVSGLVSPSSLATLAPNIVGAGLDYATASSDTYAQSTNTPLTDHLINNSGSVGLGLAGELLVNLGERPLVSLINVAQRGLYGESVQDRNIRQRGLERQQASADREGIQVTTAQRLERLNRVISTGLPSFIDTKKSLIEQLAEQRQAPSGEYTRWGAELTDLKRSWFGGLSGAEARAGRAAPSMEEGLARIEQETNLSQFPLVQSAASVLDKMFGNRSSIEHQSVRQAVSWLSTQQSPPPNLAGIKERLLDAKAFAFQPDAEDVLRQIVTAKETRESAARDITVAGGSESVGGVFNRPEGTTDISDRLLTQLQVIGIRRAAQLMLDRENSGMGAIYTLDADAGPRQREWAEAIRDEQMKIISEKVVGGEFIYPNWETLVRQRRAAGNELPENLRTRYLAGGGPVSGRFNILAANNRFGPEGVISTFNNAYNQQAARLRGMSGATIDVGNRRTIRDPFYVGDDSVSGVFTNGTRVVGRSRRITLPTLSEQQIAEASQQYGNAAYEYENFLGAADTIRSRHSIAASVNPFAAFGVGQADANTQASIAQSLLTMRQGQRDDFYRQNPTTFRFATGGRVPGVGNHDSVPSLLTPGEFVFSRKAVDNLGGAGAVDKIHRYASGGYVESGNATGNKGFLGQPVQRGDAPQTGISPEVQQMITVMNTFGQNANALAGALTNFNTNASDLARALAAFPSRLTITGTQTVEVVITGGEALARMTPEIRTMVENQCREQLNRVFRDHLPEVGVNIE